MFSCFHDAYLKEKQLGRHSEEARRWMDFIRQLETCEPYSRALAAPKSKWRKKIYSFVSSSYFETAILGAIFLNMFNMALTVEGASQTYSKTLEIIGLVFTLIFVLEAALKIFSFGWKGYFHAKWNRFDFFVVFTSLVDVGVTYSTSTDSSFLKSFQIIRVLRVLRVSRVLRLFKNLEGLNRLLQTLKWSLRALGNIFLLMCLTFCVFAILGFYTFSDIKYSDYKENLPNYNEFFNFDNFYTSFRLVFRSTTGENWPFMMEELYSSDTLISKHALKRLNSVVLEQYDEFHQKTENPIEKFDEIVVDFKKSWSKYSDTQIGCRIAAKKVDTFLLNLQGDLTEGFIDSNGEKTIDSVKKYLMDLDLFECLGK